MYAILHISSGEYLKSYLYSFGGRGRIVVYWLSQPEDITHYKLKDDPAVFTDYDDAMEVMKDTLLILLQQGQNYSISEFQLVTKG